MDLKIISGYIPALNELISSYETEGSFLMLDKEIFGEYFSASVMWQESWV